MYQDQIPWLAAVEEPEKAIHPGALALLHGAMQTTSEARSQLIITTHSPDLIANASANDLRIVEMENGVTQIDPIDEAQREVIYKKLFSPGEMMRTGGFRRAR
jgi:predicted ATPase